MPKATERGFASVAAPQYEASSVVVVHTDDPGLKSGAKFVEAGLQIAGGVPLMCGEPDDWSTFRLGLFGLEKLVRFMVLEYFLYMNSLPSMSVSEARSNLADVIDRAVSDHEPVYLARRGRRVAAVIDADDLDRLIELAEDMADIRAAEDARHEMESTAQAPIPWDLVKADLGLT